MECEGRQEKRGGEDGKKGKGGEEHGVAIFPHFRLQSRFILVCWAIFFTASSCVHRDIRQDGKRERARGTGGEGVVG